MKTIELSMIIGEVANPTIPVTVSVRSIRSFYARRNGEIGTTIITSSSMLSVNESYDEVKRQVSGA